MKIGEYLVAGAMYLLVFLNVFNWVAGIIAAVWLLSLGQWDLVVIGLLAMWLMPYAFVIAASPTYLLIMPLMPLLMRKKQNIALAMVGFTTMLYHNAILAFWTLLVFTQVFDVWGVMAIPFVVWGYNVVMTPLAHMARGESADSTATNMGLLLAQSGYIVLVIAWLLGAPFVVMIWTLSIMAILFALPSAAVMLVTRFDETEGMI